MTSYLLEACGGKVTESEKLAIWQGAERNLPITFIFKLFLAALGLLLGMGFSLVAASGGYFVVAEHGL